MSGNGHDFDKEIHHSKPAIRQCRELARTSGCIPDAKLTAMRPNGRHAIQPT